MPFQGQRLPSIIYRDSLYENAKWLNKEANKRSLLSSGKECETLINRSNEMKRQADSASLVLYKDFPLSGKINFNQKTFVRSRNIIKGAGVFQLLTGAAGLIVTIPSYLED